MTDPPADPLVLRDLALEAARAAAELVRERRTHGVQVADTKTSDVDPIDGTVNFLYGLPEYSVSIAVEVDGEVVAGVVVNAATGVEYVATAGDARRDGVPLQVRGPAPLHQRLVITGFGYDSEKRAVQAASVARLLPRVRDIRRLGSCALDLCHLAEGSADAYVEEGVNLWDYAAGAFVAAQAGARWELHPGAYGTQALVAAPAHGYEEFLDAVRTAGFLATASALEGAPKTP